MFSGFPQIPRGRWSCSHQRGSIRSQSASRGLTSNATCDMWYLYTVRSTGFFVRRLDTLACLKVDIDAMDMDGCTALHLAVKHDSVDEARTLIELEVDTTIVNAAGQTASRPPRVAIAELDPNKDINGTDALQMKGQKLCLVRRVLDSIREIYMQGLVLETGLTSEEVETN